MATFVLVHGSHDGGWVWQRLAPLLREAGHAVYAPTLTGLADRQHLIDCDVNLTTHVTDIVGLLTFEDLSDVSLVGSSYRHTGVDPGRLQPLRRQSAVAGLDRPRDRHGPRPDGHRPAGLGGGPPR